MTSLPDSRAGGEERERVTRGRSGISDQCLECAPVQGDYKLLAYKMELIILYDIRLEYVYINNSATILVYNSQQTPLKLKIWANLLNDN